MTKTNISNIESKRKERSKKIKKNNEIKKIIIRIATVDKPIILDYNNLEEMTE